MVSEAKPQEPAAEDPVVRMVGLEEERLTDRQRAKRPVAGWTPEVGLIGARGGQVSRPVRVGDT